MKIFTREPFIANALNAPSYSDKKKFTLIVWYFSEFKVVMLKTIERNSFPLISFALKDLKLHAVQRTLSLETSAELGGADVILQASPTAEALHLLSTARVREHQKQYLFTIRYQNVSCFIYFLYI